MRVLAAVAAFVLLVSGLAAWAGAFEPRIDGLTNLAPAALGLIGLAMVVWLARGRKRGRTVILMAAAAGVWLALVAPELEGLFERPHPAGGETLRLVQFNTWEKNGDWTRRRLAWLARTDPDVVTLQEIASEDTGLLAALRATYPYQITCEAAPYPCPVMVLSKAAPLAFGHFSGGAAPQANTAWVRFAGRKRAFTVVAVHVDRPWPDGRQDAELRRLSAQLRGFELQSLVLAGDFNAAPWSFAMRRLERTSGLQRRTVALPSWPGWFPVLPIDHVWAGSAWDTAEVRRGPFLGSDHRPIVVTLRRP